MKLPHYGGEQERAVSFERFGQKLESIDPESFDDRLKIIFHDDNSAVAGLRVNKGWQLLLEDSNYEPSGEFFDEETELPPFMTAGTMWSVDIGTGLVGTEEFTCNEGEIQGVVYALDAFMNGGVLPSNSYVDYMIKKYIEIDRDAKYEQQETSASVLNVNSGLAFLLEKSNLVTISSVTVRSGMQF